MKLKHRFNAKSIFAALLAAGMMQAAYAELARVGPIDPAHGFPKWFQDKKGLALDFCLPKDQADLEQMNCLLGTADVLTLPEVFPTNFFDEHFWYAAGAAADTGPLGTVGGKALLVLATEAAFAAEVAPGGQIVFNRIRVVLNPVPADGTYRFITPYSVHDFPGAVAGDRIFFTDDVGVGCPQPDFSCALSSQLGPFLRASATEGGTALPFVQINGTTMIADPGVATTVTGGTVSNKFRVEYFAPGHDPNVDPLPDAFTETNQFTVMGRVHTDPIPSPMNVARATYSRSSSGAYIDVFANAQAGLAGPDQTQATPSLAIAAGPGVPGTLMSAGNPDLQQVYPFWGQAPVSGTVPASVQVINNADVPPTVVTATVTDAVTVTEALYDPAQGKLTVKARSSDTASTDPAQLLLEGYGLACDDVLGASVSISSPPATVTVISTKGGKSTAPVLVKSAGSATTSPLLIVDTSASTAEDTPTIVDLAAATGQSGTFSIQATPAHGSLVANATSGSYTYYPAPNYFGADSFTYTVTVNGQTSNVATASLAVSSVNDGPVANPDGGTTTVGTPVIVNVLANDVDPDSDTGLDPASVVVANPPATASVLVGTGLNGVPAGSISVSSTQAGEVSFSYTVSDKATPAASASATVTVTIVGAENLQVARARYITSKDRWQIDGTSNVHDGQAVTVYTCPDSNNTQPTCSPGALGTTLVGSATVDATGVWAIDKIGPVPANPAAVTAYSARGGQINADVARK